MAGRWAPHVSVSQRRRRSASGLAQLTKSGQSMSPIIIEGRTIAATPWGKAWCANVERYSDDANRLPRGRSYVRNGSVIDLQVTPGQVAARVSGSSIYRTTITVQPVPRRQWQQICTDCAGGIDSLVALLQGRLSQAVMDRLCRSGDGLFPAPRDIRFDCSCPDGATMCKHVAAVLYGVGARLDRQPELLFTLRQVEAADLLSQAGKGVATALAVGTRTLVDDDLSALFGLDMDAAAAAVPPAPPPRPALAPSPASAPSRTTPPARPAATASTTRARDPAVRLLAALRQAGWLDNARARAATGLDADSVRPLLKQLVSDGHARVQGQRGTSRFERLRFCGRA